MSDFPDTRESLLVQVKDPGNREAWDQFAQIYQPIIFRIAIARGLQDADAHDLAQKVLIAVAAAIGRWEKSNDTSKFRHWLSKVTKNAILNALTRRPRDQAVGGSTQQSLLHEVSASDDETEELILREYRRELYLRAAAIVRKEVQPETWRIFEMTVVERHAINHVADQLGKSVGAIYSARSRVMLRLRETVRDLEGEES